MLNVMKTKVDEMRIAYAAYRLYRDPTRLQDVLDVGTKLTSSLDLERLAAKLAAMSPEAARAMETRRVIDYDPAEMGGYAEGTLGRAVHRHCAKWEISPKVFVGTRPNTTPGEHILVHIENTHDILHPIMGFEADPPGEVGVQAFYLGQMPNLLGLLAIGIAHFRVLGYHPLEYPQLLDTVARGWLLGKRARPVFGVEWDRYFDWPLEDVRREFRVDVAAVDAFLGPGSNDAVSRARAMKGLGGIGGKAIE